MFSQIDKRIAKSWREYAVEPRLAKLTGRVLRRTGPRIAVVGNCQAFGIAYAMKLLDPSATVDHFSAIGRSRASFDLFIRTLDTYDHIFLHEFPHGHIPGGDSDELLRRLPQKSVVFPAVVFAAFHPDLVYLVDHAHGDAQLFGPLGPYHSALAVFAFRKGLSLEEANALYDDSVFQALGYYDVWNDCAQEFLSYSNRFGFDLSTELMNWSRRGVFMYSIVHPRPFVMADIAKRLFAHVGLKVREMNMDHYAIDDLARAEIFPIYPEIADRFGTRGGYLFKMGNFHVSHGVGDFLNLPQYLASCYKIYAGATNEQMWHPRIVQWLDDAAVSDTLIRLVKENLKAGRTPVL
jgi:hypothetical protein